MGQKRKLELITLQWIHLPCCRLLLCKKQQTAYIQRRINPGDDGTGVKPGKKKKKPSLREWENCIAHGIFRKVKEEEAKGRGFFLWCASTNIDPHIPTHTLSFALPVPPSLNPRCIQQTAAAAAESYAGCFVMARQLQTSRSAVPDDVVTFISLAKTRFSIAFNYTHTHVCVYYISAVYIFSLGEGYSALYDRIVSVVWIAMSQVSI